MEGLLFDRTAEAQVFVVAEKDGRVSCFKDAEDKLPEQSFVVDATAKVEALPDTKRGHYDFAVQLPTQRWVFGTVSKEERQKWVVFLQAVGEFGSCLVVLSLSLCVPDCSSLSVGKQPKNSTVPAQQGATVPPL